MTRTNHTLVCVPDTFQERGGRLPGLPLPASACPCSQGKLGASQADSTCKPPRPVVMFCSDLSAAVCQMSQRRLQSTAGGPSVLLCDILSVGPSLVPPHARRQLQQAPIWRVAPCRAFSAAGRRAEHHIFAAGGRGRRLVRRHPGLQLHGGAAPNKLQRQHRCLPASRWHTLSSVPCRLSASSCCMLLQPLCPTAHAIHGLKQSQHTASWTSSACSW